MNIYKPEGCNRRSAVNYEYISTAEGLERAMNEGVILEWQVHLCDHAYDLHLELPSGIHGIIPRTEVQLSSGGAETKDIAILTRVGKTVCFKVIGFTERGGERIAVLSRKAAQAECYEYYVKALSPGDIIPARVTHTEGFGAFLDIGCGIPSLLSIDTISVSRISHPKDRLRVGDNIFVAVKGKDNKGRIYASTRELLGTWEENAARFREGETVVGCIRSVESYGVFVELMPNLAGLAEYREDATPGMAAAVYIKSIIPEKMKIKLIIIDLRTELTEPVPLQYFIDPVSNSRIDSWTYSPSCSKKLIETVF